MPHIYTSSGAREEILPQINLDSYNLVDSALVTALSWDARILQDQAGVLSMGFGNDILGRSLVNSSSQVVLDWNTNTFKQDLTFTNGKNIIFNTSTGTKIGTATTQKIGFFNATPVVQQTGSSDVLASLVTLGLRAASSNPPLDIGTGTFTGGNATIATSITNSSLTASRAVVTDGSKVLVSSATTATELGYVNGVTSAIQTQLDSKASSASLASYLPLAGGTMTGAILFSADNTIDIGASGATRPRTAYFGTSAFIPTVTGATASGGNLTLLSTSNATKGKILFGTSAYDEVNNRLGIGSATPTAPAYIETNAIGITPSDSNGVLLKNTTAGTAALSQYSPSISWFGENTNTAGSTRRTHQWRMYCAPVTSVNNGGSTMVLESSTAGAAYANPFSFKSAGNLGIGTSTPSVLSNIEVYGSNAGAGFNLPSISITNSNTTNGGSAHLGFNIINSTPAQKLAADIMCIGQNHTATTEAADLVFSTMKAGSLTEAMRILDVGTVVHAAPVRLKVYTVAGLPAGVQGDTAVASDLLAPTFLAAAVGGGAIVGPVYYDGTAWKTF